MSSERILLPVSSPFEVSTLSPCCRSFGKEISLFFPHSCLPAGRFVLAYREEGFNEEQVEKVRSELSLLLEQLSYEFSSFLVIPRLPNNCLFFISSTDPERYDRLFFLIDHIKEVSLSVLLIACRTPGFSVNTFRLPRLRHYPITDGKFLFDIGQ